MEIKMKLSFADKFTIETEINNEDVILTGKFKRLDKKQELEIKKKFKKDLDLIEELTSLARKANKLELRLQINPDDSSIKEESLALFDKVNELQDLITKSNAKEAMAKYRFDISIESDDMTDLIAIGETYGYSELINAISEDVEAGKQKNTKV
jgi:hypothetical protein